MGILTKVEEIISIPLEVFHNRKGFHPVDLNRLALRCMEKGTRKGINKVYAPNRFRVLLNPEDYRELHPFLETIRSDISGELRRVVDERQYQLAGDLTVRIIRDAETPEGLPQVKGHMQGGDEPESTISRLKDETSEYRRASAHLDAETVIVLPEPDEPESLAEAAFEEGITVLREGKAEEAQELFSKSADELNGRPEFHAALAVVMEMLGRRFDAMNHYKQLQAIDGPRPQVQRRIEFVNSERYGRLEMNRLGVALLFGDDGVYLQNRDLDPDVQVDGKVLDETRLTDGAGIRVGDFEMVYRSGPGDK